MSKCEICSIEFEGSRRTCSKICKNELARRITNKQFADPAAREVQRQRSLAQKKDPAHWEKFNKSIAARDANWELNGHPRIGMVQPDTAKAAIGLANKGRFKGKTWDEMYGKEVAARRRSENSLSMSKKNEVLLKEKRSSLEEKILPFLPSYKNNVQISRYNVDFIDDSKKHIIEINGDYWHCNPKLYADDWVHPYFKITAKQRQQLDEDRKRYLESLGYSVTIVWESDLDEFIKTLC